MGNFALLILRATLGLMMAGHGSQKLFGWFNGPGMEGTGDFMESLGLKPGSRWAALAASSEFGGGALTTLGLLNPLGPLGIVGAMAMATRTVHWKTPILANEGGPEVPLVYIVISTVLMMSGDGKYSMDHALGLRLPRWIAPIGFAIALLTVAGTVTGEIIEEESGGESDEPESL